MPAVIRCREIFFKPGQSPVTALQRALGWVCVSCGLLVASWAIVLRLLCPQALVSSALSSA